MAHDQSWEKIYNDFKIGNHDFSEKPFELSADQIKQACQNFKKTGEKKFACCANRIQGSRVPPFSKNMGYLYYPRRMVFTTL